MGHHITLQACAALRGGFIALAMLALACGASAREYLPRGFYGKEPSAWQRAGIEAALNDPSVWVQGHMLRECAERKWVSHLRIPTTQWLLWLGSPLSEVRDVAAEAAGQLGAQMPPEVQRALIRLQTLPGGDFLVARSSLQALSQTGAGLIPEVQLAELLCLQRPQGSYEMESLVWQTLGQSGAAMVPEVLHQLLTLMQRTQTAMAVRCGAAEILARLGPQLPAQAREIMLRMLLDPQADTSLRCRAAQAMGGLGAQMPPQAQALLHAMLRDRAADGSLRYYAAAALAKMGAKMPPEVQAALLAAYAEQPTEATIKDHEVFHEEVAESLGALGTAMPLNVQQELVARFLKTARTPQPDYSALYSLQKAGPHAAPAVLRTLLAALQDTGIDEQARSSIGTFFQRLAEHGHLPLEVQEAVTALVQDEAADRDARCLGALILGQLGGKATAEATHALCALLHCADPMLRIHGLQAMKLLGPHMPQEAIPVLITILKKRANPSAASTTDAAGDISALVPTGGFMPSLDPLDYVLPALGRLGPQMPPEARVGLLALLLNRKAPRTATALALAQMGDGLPPEIQQCLIAELLETETAPKPDGALCTAISQTLSVSGLLPVSDALLADTLSLAHAKSMDPDMQRAYFYLWFGRSPALLQAVRWLGHQTEDPPLGDTPPQEVLRLIARLWPQSAPHAELRHEMARRTGQILTAHLKTRPLDAATQTVLHTLASQLAEDAAPDCVTALQQVQAALAAGAKAP